MTLPSQAADCCHLPLYVREPLTDLLKSSNLTVFIDLAAIISMYIIVLRSVFLAAIRMHGPLQYICSSDYTQLSVTCVRG